MKKQKAPEGSFQSKLDTIKSSHTRLKKDEPFLNNTWWEIKDVPLDELRDYAKSHRMLENFHLEKYTQTMQLQVTNMPMGITVFAYSTKVKIKKHIVDAFAYENV